jgi:DNA-directed RNA polymerase beta subunit
MGKAALGEPQEVDESRAYMRLPDAQVPLVQTAGERMLQTRYTRSGKNVVVAIMCFQGNNQEDSLNMCKQDLQLGLFRTWDYTLYSDTASFSSRGDPQTFEAPGEDVRGRRDCDYSVLGPEGFVEPGTVIRGGSAVIGKTARLQSGTKRDQSTLAEESAPPGTVTSVVIADTKERRRVRVQVARPAVPIIGDKFSARHGQKGVIGDKVERADMPWGILRVPVRDAEGNLTGTRTTEVRPNIIMNPNAIPSRMTVGQLLEMMAGTAAAVGGYVADGTSFKDAPGIGKAAVQEELRRLGLNPSGTARMYSGITGEELGNAEVFMGVCYYQRLKQLAEAKARAVDRGMRSALTRQPMEGKGGGLRAGEMERDALIAHGAPEIVTNTYLVRSDDYVAHACTRCGMLAAPPRIPDPRLRHLGQLRDHAGYCSHCRTAEHVARFRTPYALKLMIQELTALGVVPRLRVQASGEIDFANAPAPGVPASYDSLPKLIGSGGEEREGQGRESEEEQRQPRRESEEEQRQPRRESEEEQRQPRREGQPRRGGEGRGTLPMAPAPATAAPRALAAVVRSLPGGIHIKGPDVAEHGRRIPKYEVWEGGAYG